MDNQSDCYCLNIRRAAQAITNIYDKCLASTGLSSSQYSILNALHGLKKVSVSKLAIALRLDRTTLVRNLKPLEEKGLVIDVAYEGRNRQMQLTEYGLQICKDASPLWLEAQRKLEQLLGKDNLEVLLRIAKKIDKWDE
jgi:DNA-binding MarR family transcriptional regulator